LAAAMASFELGKGHVCLPLPATRCFELDADEQAALLQGLPPLASWPERFAASALVYQQPDSPIDNPQTGPASGNLPLSLWRSRLYLTRYQRYETLVARTLCELAKQVDYPEICEPLKRLFARDYARIFTALSREREHPAFAADAFLRKYLDLVTAEGLDWPAITALLAGAQEASALQALDTLIPEAHCCNDQLLAAATAAGRAFTLISGGPGTGKTTTVARLLALLIEQGMASGKAPVIRLVAPTGKAAARLTESLGGALQALPVSAEVKALMPTTAGTLHRLLGVIPGRLSFRHHADNPLHLDILVVDEASMVDLPMMARLLMALPRHARLVLLGDKDQLASVEAGAVLGDICAALELPRTQEHAAWLMAQSGYRVAGEEEGLALRDGLCLLRKSWRFDASSGIGELARCCNRGDGDALAALWQRGFEDIAITPWQGGGYERLLQQVVNGYAPYLQAMQDGAAPATIFALFNQFQLLCALREGEYGVSGLNEQIARRLERRGLIRREYEWYAGRPVMVVQNDHAISLYNGDMGLCLPDEQGRLRVWFEQPDGSLRALLPSRLPEHDTVYAMTIHKSQGSEFKQVVMALPERFSPLLTRELVYTGITRAKSRLDLYADASLLAQAIRRKTERYSGLAARLLNENI
nr:exodeoxyribonuclease V subunit alpha [Aeromonadaceae bacterium]